MGPRLLEHELSWETTLPYFRGFNLILSGRRWWQAPLVFAAVDLAFGAVGSIPLVGVVAIAPALAALFLFFGWIAAAQRAAYYGDPGLPAPFRSEYFLDGARGFVVGSLWLLPIAGAFTISFSFVLIPSEVGAVLFLFANVASLLFTVTWIPLVGLAVTRSNLARDWTGCDPRIVTVTLMKVPIESYVGVIVWCFAGVVLGFFGILACFIGLYFVRPLWSAALSVFWVDVMKLAVDRGAPPHRVVLPALPFASGSDAQRASIGTGPESRSNV